MRYLLTYKWFGEDHTVVCERRAEAVEKAVAMTELVEYTNIGVFREVLDLDLLEAMDALHDCETLRFAGVSTKLPDEQYGKAFKWGCPECGQSWTTHVYRDGRRDSRRVGDPAKPWPKIASR